MSAMGLEVIKVTRSLTAGSVKIAIIPKESMRGRAREVEIDADTERRLNGDRLGYFKATWVNGGWKIKRRIYGNTESF